MVAPWLAEVMNTASATFQPYRTACHTSRSQVGVLILSCCEVMAVPLLWEGINMDSATFHLSVKTCHTSRSMRVDFIACSFEAMVWLWLLAGIIMANATFQRSKSMAVSMLQIQLGPVGRISFCRWTLPSKTWWLWPGSAPTWPGWRGYASRPQPPTWPRRFTCASPATSRPGSRTCSWCCRTDGCCWRSVPPIPRPPCGWSCLKTWHPGGNRHQNHHLLRPGCLAKRAKSGNRDNMSCAAKKKMMTLLYLQDVQVLIFVFFVFRTAVLICFHGLWQ